MPTPPPRPRQLDSPLLPKVFKYMSKAQVWVYRRTGGRIGGTWRVGAGFRKPVPTLLLDHRGRKSGKVFTTPLLYMADGDDVVVVASQGGLPKHPQWYLNLCAHPDTHVQIGGQRRAVVAVTADAEQRARLWPRLVDAYADFATYQTWTDREIPVVILRPRADDRPAR
jgi:F420H(2)-dependent quinone reductase